MVSLMDTSFSRDFSRRVSHRYHGRLVQAMLQGSGGRLSSFVDSGSQSSHVGGGPKIGSSRYGGHSCSSSPLLIESGHRGCLIADEFGHVA